MGDQSGVWQYSASGLCFVLGLVVGFKLKKPILNISSVVLGKRTKLVLIVRDDIKMGKGKMAAQCCHATLMAYTNGTKKDPNLMQQWMFSGQPKVVLKAKDLEEIQSLQKLCNQSGILENLVRDAGKTQLESGTETVLAVGPHKVSLVDEVTGNLKLL